MVAHALTSGVQQGDVVDATRGRTVEHRAKSGAGGSGPGQVIPRHSRGYDAVVAPSGSCGGMLSHHYRGLFDDDPAMKARAEGLANRSYELMAFLADVLGVTKVTVTHRRQSSRGLLECAGSHRRTP